MRSVFFVLLAVVSLAALSGCVHDRMCCSSSGQNMTCALPGSCANCPETCQTCCADPCNVFAGCRIWDGYGPYDPRAAQQAINPGPPTGAVTYPYYTIRGPRDFLARDYRSIGP